tara:strand:+ start:1133 stop:2230 length:1098 start_codon:yes stop_codon:yes gene_type:complete
MSKPIKISLILIAVFLFGTFVGFLLSDTSISDLNYNTNGTGQSTQNLNSININEYVKFSNIEDIHKKRLELINFIWKSNSLPSQQPVVDTNFNDDRFSDLTNLQKIEKITLEMDHGFISQSYLFLPDNANGKLIIYHQGHSGGFINGKQTIQDFLNAGFSVAAFSMPLHGLNNQPTENIPNIGSVKFFKHNQFVLLESENFSSLELFFSPINSTLNYLENHHSFEEFFMVGISGGGWTSTVYPALDTRISKSFSVAGSLPLSLRNVIDDVGDYEQFHPELYSIANYFELYVLNSTGEEREFYQIFNKNDPCCFAGDAYKIYHEPLKKFVSQFDSGNFDIMIDDSHKEHKISKNTTEFIIQHLLNS